LSAPQIFYPSHSCTGNEQDSVSPVSLAGKLHIHLELIEDFSRKNSGLKIRYNGTLICIVVVTEGKIYILKFEDHTAPEMVYTHSKTLDMWLRTVLLSNMQEQ
jgi:hypothetical protein